MWCGPVNATITRRNRNDRKRNSATLGAAMGKAPKAKSAVMIVSARRIDLIMKYILVTSELYRKSTPRLPCGQESL